MEESSWPPAAPAPDVEASEEVELEVEEPAEEPPRGRLVTGLLIGGLVVMTALAATFLALWLGNSDIEPDEVRTYLDAERPEIEERARIAADILLNYDAARIAEQREEMLAISTGDFKEDYEQFTEPIAAVLEETAASSRGSILEEPTVAFTSPAEADVTIRAEQITQTSENPTGRTIQYVLRLGLIDTQGGWKVDNIDILSEEIT